MAAVLFFFQQTNKETVELIYSDNTKGWSVISGYIEGTLGLQGSPAAPTIGKGSEFATKAAKEFKITERQAERLWKEARERLKERFKNNQEEILENHLVLKSFR